MTRSRQEALVGAVPAAVCCKCVLQLPLYKQPGRWASSLELGPRSCVPISMKTKTASQTQVHHMPTPHAHARQCMTLLVLQLPLYKQPRRVASSLELGPRSCVPMCFCMGLSVQRLPLYMQPRRGRCSLELGPRSCVPICMKTLTAS